MANFNSDPSGIFADMFATEDERAERRRRQRELVDLQKPDLLPSGDVKFEPISNDPFETMRDMMDDVDNLPPTDVTLRPNMRYVPEQQQQQQRQQSRVIVDLDGDTDEDAFYVLDSSEEEEEEDTEDDEHSSEEEEGNVPVRLKRPRPISPDVPNTSKRPTLPFTAGGDRGWEDAFKQLGRTPTPEQQASIEACVQSKGHMVIANTGWGKSTTILGVAIHFALQGQPVLILVRKSTVAQFEAEFKRISPRPNVQLMVHERFRNDGKEFMNLETGHVRQSKRLEQFLAKDTVVLIDECQMFASSTLTNAQGNVRVAPVVAMALCASQASRVYLFSATPCSEDANELKTLLCLLKRQSPGGARAGPRFNLEKIADYVHSTDGTVSNEVLPNDENPVTYNFRCLVSFYQPDRSAKTYLDHWVDLRTRRVEVKMRPDERRNFEKVERDGGWGKFGAKLRAASETKSKMDKMFEVLKHELNRFNGTGVKPRILIYTYLQDYADRIWDEINRRLPKTNPIRLAAGQFDTESARVQPYAKRQGESNIAVITDAGVTGFDPPPLTAIIAMNAFWSPASRIQLEGRLNRYRKHMFMNTMGIDKTMHVYQLLAVKEVGEVATATNEVVKPFGYDTRQDFVVTEKAQDLAVMMKELCRASRQHLSDKECTQSYVTAKLNSPTEYL